MGLSKKIVIQSQNGQNKQVLVAIDWSTFQKTWQKNESYQLDFTAYDDRTLAFELLSVESSVYFDGQQYIIKQVTDDNNGGAHTVQVTATHVYYQLNNRYQYNIKNGDNAFTLSNALDFLMDGINAEYSYQIHGDFSGTKTLTDFGNVAIGDGLSTIKETFGIYAIVPDNRIINLFSEKEYTKETNKAFRYRHDTDEVQLQYDSTSIVNRVQAVSTNENPAFEPFFVQDQDSINVWGIKDGGRVESDTITDTNKMRTLASQSFVLQPTITLTVSSSVNQEVNPGEIWAVQMLENEFLTKVEVVSITETPFSPTTPIQVELNNTRANFLDAQKAQSKMIRNIQDKQNNASSINVWVVGNVED